MNISDHVAVGNADCIIWNKRCEHSSKFRIVIHCTVLPPGEFNDMISVQFSVYCENFMA